MIVLAIVFTAAAWLIFSVGPITKHFGGAPSIFAFGALETIRLQVVHASEASLNQLGVMGVWGRCKPPQRGREIFRYLAFLGP